MGCKITIRDSGYSAPSVNVLQFENVENSLPDAYFILIRLKSTEAISTLEYYPI